MSTRLHVDPIACVAHGLCAELLPEWIELDEWGYPIIEDGALPEGLLDLAERAASACPTLALRLERQSAPARPSARARSPRREPARRG